jgi:hypothetical protein
VEEVRDDAIGGLLALDWTAVVVAVARCRPAQVRRPRSTAALAGPALVAELVTSPELSYPYPKLWL